MYISVKCLHIYYGVQMHMFTYKYAYTCILEALVHAILAVSHAQSRSERYVYSGVCTYALYVYVHMYMCICICAYVHVHV